MIEASVIESIKRKYEQLEPFLTERTVRMWCAAEAESIGYGGVTAVCKATGISRPTIHKGLQELNLDKAVDPERIRQKGGGRKKITQTDPTLLGDLDVLIEPATRGDPENPLRWSSKSTLRLTEELRKKGHPVTQPTVYYILREQAYSLKSNRKTKEGVKEYPDRDAQFQFINEKSKEFLKERKPILSVDTKKKENVGNFKNNGKEWMPKGELEEVTTHDFPDKELGKAAPYGVYDVHLNKGWVSVEISHDTAEFAVQSIRTWWAKMGKDIYKDAPEIMITADCGGSNSTRGRLWKYELQKLADEIDKSIRVCHFPPGTSKWNKIEHRMFSFISQNWRGRPLTDLQTIVELIGHTTTKKGLKIVTDIDRNHYDTGKKVSKEDFNSINLEQEKFQGQWNYIIYPRNKTL
jgi:Rhodopirellula transposase DDE domain